MTDATRRITRAVAVIALVAAAAGRSEASLQITISGTVRAYNPGSSLPANAPTAYTATIRFDDAAADTNPDASLGRYAILPLTATITIGSQVITIDSSAPKNTQVDTSLPFTQVPATLAGVEIDNSATFDRYALSYSDRNDLAAATAYENFTLQLLGVDFLASDALLGVVPGGYSATDPGDLFTYSVGRPGATASSFTGSIGSITRADAVATPEPGAIAMLASGVPVALVAWRGRRRRVS